MLKIKSIKFVNDPVFKNKMFDFTTRSNDVASTVIIVGENGSGKTRLINILKQLTDFIFLNDKKHFLYKEISKDNHTYFTKQEIEHNNDFYLNAWKYEIEYEYTITPKEEELSKKEYSMFNSYLKKEINYELGYKVLYFKLHISTSFNQEKSSDDDKNTYPNFSNTYVYLIEINKVNLFDDKKNPINNEELNKNISNKFLKTIYSNSTSMSSLWELNSIYCMLKKDLPYTYYFHTLQELSINNDKYNKSHILKLIEENEKLRKENKDLKNKLDPIKDENKVLNSENDILNNDEKNYHDFIDNIKNNQSYEEFLLNVYQEEFNIENIEYNFSKLDINLFKLNNYARAINQFLKNASNKDVSYLELDKITKNKIHFKKDNNNLYYEELSTGEKKFLYESIFFLKMLFYKFANTNDYYKNYLDQLNIIHQINMIYFIDEIELSFHPWWISNILNFLKKCLENAYGQIFISTHSEIIPYSIDIKTDTLINMNDDKETVSFKNYNSIQDFVNNSLHVDYEDFIDEYDIWVEGRSDKVLLNTAIQELNEEGSKTTISFNIRFANNFKFNKHSSDHNDDLNKEFNKLINGAVGVRTQFLSWLSKNDKKNNSLKEIKPKFFIFDNDCEGQEKYKSIISILNQKHILNQIKIEFNKIIDNKIFDGWEVRRQRKDFKEQKSFILIYKNKEEIEDFIENKEIRENCKNNKANIEEIIKNNNNWKQKIANSFEKYIKALQEILSNKQQDNNDNLYFWIKYKHAFFS